MSAGGGAHPPATMRTISSRSPSARARPANWEGATASPLCSTTTLRGGIADTLSPRLTEMLLLARQQMTRALDLMGAVVPGRM